MVWLRTKGRRRLVAGHQQCQNGHHQRERQPEPQRECQPALRPIFYVSTTRVCLITGKIWVGVVIINHGAEKQMQAAGTQKSDQNQYIQTTRPHNNLLT